MVCCLTILLGTNCFLGEGKPGKRKKREYKKGNNQIVKAAEMNPK